MEQWTPYILLALTGVGVMLWFGLRAGLKRLSDMSAQLALMVNVPNDITNLVNTVRNMERQMLDEHRRFDNRITWLEAHNPPRVQPGAERP